MAVSKGITLALDLGTPSCSRGPLAFDLGPQLAQGAPGSSKGASFTIYLGTSLALGANLLLIWGSIELQGLWYPGAPLTIALEPLALGAHCLLISSPCLFHGTPLALDLGPQLSPGAP